MTLIIETFLLENSFPKPPLHVSKSQSHMNFEIHMDPTYLRTLNTSIIWQIKPKKSHITSAIINGNVLYSLGVL